MNELRDEFNAFRVQQEVLNESYRERFFSIDERIQSIKQKPEENNGTFSNVVQTQDIQNKLQTFEERITSRVEMEKKSLGGRNFFQRREPSKRPCVTMFSH